MIREIKSYPILMGARGGEKVDVDALEEALVRFSLLAWEQGLAEGEANPLRVTPQGVVALDARFVLGGYIKPVGTLPVWSKEHGLVDQDAFFFSQALGLGDPMELMAPYVGTRDRLSLFFKGEEDVPGKALDAFRKISRGKDLVIIGGGIHL